MFSNRACRDSADEQQTVEDEIPEASADVSIPLLVFPYTIFLLLKELALSFLEMLTGGWPWVAAERCETGRGRDATGFCHGH
jgi:hypothetical protein